MSSRYTSAFDELLERNRRELDALYEDRGGRGASRPGRTPPAPAPPGTAPVATAPESGETAPAGPIPAASPAERRLTERYGDAWRFEVTSRRRENDEIIVVGTLRLPGSGGVRTQFGSARIAASGGSTAGSAGGVVFSFGGGAGANPLAAEEAAFERAREDALASCADLL